MEGGPGWHGRGAGVGQGWPEMLGLSGQGRPSVPSLQSAAAWLGAGRAARGFPINKFLQDTIEETNACSTLEVLLHFFFFFFHWTVRTVGRIL